MERFDRWRTAQKNKGIRGCWESIDRATVSVELWLLVLVKNSPPAQMFRENKHQTTGAPPPPKKNTRSALASRYRSWNGSILRVNCVSCRSLTVTSDTCSLPILKMKKLDATVPIIFHPKIDNRYRKRASSGIITAVYIFALGGLFFFSSERYTVTVTWHEREIGMSLLFSLRSVDGHAECVLPELHELFWIGFFAPRPGEVLWFERDTGLDERRVLRNDENSADSWFIKREDRKFHRPGW